jgi:hypothetical protein
MSVEHNYEKFISVSSRLNPQRLRLEGHICPDCGTPYLDNRPVCPNQDLHPPSSSVIQKLQTKIGISIEL